MHGVILPPRRSAHAGLALERFGCNGGFNRDNITTRPTYVANNLLTWIMGSYTVKAGLEYRNIGGNIHNTSNE